MQPVEAQKGCLTKSQLFNSLKVYLNNKTRLQPIIGLGSIIECVRAGAHNREALYLCEVCVCRFSKADILNHITGSLHRYNYINVWHRHLVSKWKEISDLSRLAWPLMDIAKILEGKEGPGKIQLLEVEDAVYQMMATHSENDAVTLMNLLRDGHGESESHSESTTMELEDHPLRSQRIVLLSHSQVGLSSAETTYFESEGWLDCRSAPQTSPESSVLSENSNSSPESYTGAKPLIGLSRVFECRSEEGHTSCFLCHCCRIRSNKNTIIDHLTSSSHLVNYLMETHPEQVEVMLADIDDNYQFLHSLARRVEQDEGRGKMKVVNASESLCTLLTGKSYHWCIKMLCNGGTHTDTQRKKIAVKGPSVNKASNQEKCAVAVSKWATKKARKRKMRREINPVFKVIVPVSSACSPSSDSDLLTTPHGSQESLPTHNEGLLPAVYNNQDSSAYYPEPWYDSSEPSSENTWWGMSADAAQHYYQQQPQSQYMAQGPYGEYAAHFNAAGTNTYPHGGHYFPHSGSIAPEDTHRECSFMNLNRDNCRHTRSSPLDRQLHRHLRPIKLSE